MVWLILITDFLNFVMALSPIIVVLVGILGLRQSAKRVAPVALVWTLVRRWAT